MDGEDDVASCHGDTSLTVLPVVVVSIESSVVLPVTLPPTSSLVFVNCMGPALGYFPKCIATTQRRTTMAIARTILRSLSLHENTKYKMIAKRFYCRR